MAILLDLSLPFPMISLITSVMYDITLSEVEEFIYCLFCLKN